MYLNRFKIEKPLSLNSGLTSNGIKVTVTKKTVRKFINESINQAKPQAQNGTKKDSALGMVRNTGGEAPRKNGKVPDVETQIMVRR
jgi:hypothetical protein